MCTKLVLTLFHMIGVFKDPRVTNFISYFLFGFAQITMEFRLFPFCEYIEEDMLGSLKTTVCVSASIFVHVE